MHGTEEFEAKFSKPQVLNLIDSLPDANALHATLLQARGDIIDLRRGDFYPEILRAELTLRTILSELSLVPLECVFVNHGSNGSIDTLLTCHALRSRHPKPRLVLQDPTYFRVYASAKARDFEILEVDSSDGYHLDVEAMKRTITEKSPDIVYLCSPNNPTGIAISDQAFDEIFSACGRNSFVILDRTLANIAPQTSSADLLARYRGKNLVILHSFSKYCSLAEYRVGVLLFASDAYASVFKPFCPLGVNMEGCLRAVSYLMTASEIMPSPTVLSNIRCARECLDLSDEELQITPFTGNYGLILSRNASVIKTLRTKLDKESFAYMDGLNFPRQAPQCIRIHTACPTHAMEKLRDIILDCLHQPA